MEFILSNEERFIYSDEKYKNFKIKQSSEDFEKGFATSFVEFKEYKLPDKDNKKHFKATLERFRDYLTLQREENIKKELKDAVLRVDIKHGYPQKLKFYEDEIKRLECLIFLQKRYGIKMKRRKLVRPDSSVSFSGQTYSSS